MIDVLAADDDEWVVVEGETDGFLSSIRYRPALESVMGHAEYPRRFIVTWEYGDDGESGQPNAEQIELLEQFESDLDDVLDPERIAILAFVFTHRGVREWNYYIADVGLVAARVNEALAEQPELPIDMEAVEDPTWEEYGTLLEGVRGAQS